jgi:hypothetical protein
MADYLRSDTETCRESGSCPAPASVIKPGGLGAGFAPPTSTPHSHLAWGWCCSIVNLVICGTLDSLSYTVA